MKNYLRYSIMITLILVMIIGSANAQSIGTSLQANPYESIPTARANSTTPIPTLGSAANMMDGDGGSYGTIYASGTTGTFYWLRFGAFGNAPPGGEFTITWVTLTIKYAHPLGMVDDQYKWEWSIGGSTWTELTAPTLGKFDSGGFAQMRAFKLVEPTDGVWDWTEIGGLFVRYYVTKGSTSFDGVGRPLRIHELWLSVYSTPEPSGTSMSLQAPAITAADAAGQTIFVDVYCSETTALAGFQYQINYDPAIMMATEYYNYYPWTDISVPDLGADYINIDGSIPVADPLVNTGLTGSFKVSRVYFMINDDGTGLPPAPNFSWLRLTVSLMGDPSSPPVKIPHAVYDGYYGTPPEMAYIASWVPASPFPYASPISTHWVELYPTPDRQWHLSDWTDNGGDGLNPSDQIWLTSIVPPGTQKEFHVDQIWETDTGFTDKGVHMILTDKGGVPEFPLGLGILMLIAPAIPLAYIWRTRRKVNKK